jgi:hypothetical protein
MSIGASVTHERALETRDLSYVPRAAKPFFIHVVHSPPGAMGHVAAPELTSTRRRGPELRDTWWRRSSPQQGGEVRGRGTHGGSGVHLCRELWSEATAYVAARRGTSCSLFTYSLYAGVSGLRGTGRGPRTHLTRGCEPACGANSSALHSIILNFLIGSRRRTPVDAGAGGPESPTINAKKY